MSSDRNNETLESLKREIKNVQTKCVNVYQVIENSPQDMPTASSEELRVIRMNNYIEGLRTEVLNSKPLSFTDDNLLTSQFLVEIQQKTEQLEEMKAFVKGNIHDMNAEINRVQSLIDISKEAKLKPKTTVSEVKREHLFKAKEKFSMMKALLSGLIQSLFPDCHESIIEVLSTLMSSINENPNGYIPITAKNYKLIGLLQDMNIVTTNPYNTKEVKLAY